MHRLPLLLTIVPLFMAPARADCLTGDVGQPGCEALASIHIGAAVLGGPVLIWAGSRAALVPVPEDGVWTVVPSIPLDRIIGRRVAPFGRGTVQGVTYNTPESAPDLVGGGTVLTPLLKPHRPARLRGEYP